jgi:hypothetical protein
VTGTSTLAAVNASGVLKTGVGSGGSISVGNNEITGGLETNADNTILYININGYLGSSTKYRDTIIGNGRGASAIAVSGGATSAVAIPGSAVIGSATMTGNALGAVSTTAASFTAYIWNQATSGNNSFIEFSTETGGTSRGSITYNRAGGLVAYNVTSDYRAKDITGKYETSGETIDQLQVYMGKMKGATIARPMMIAHEAASVVPYAVTGEKDAEDEKGDPIYQSMDHQIFVPLLIAEVQSLRNRLKQLENRTPQ